MAVIIGRQKMTVRHAEGEHTIFPSAEPQSLPDALLSHSHVQGAVQAGWITVMPVSAPHVESDEPAQPSPAEPSEADKPARKRRSS